MHIKLICYPLGANANAPRELSGAPESYRGEIFTG